MRFIYLFIYDVYFEIVYLFFTLEQFINNMFNWKFVFPFIGLFDILYLLSLFIYI